MGIAIGLAALTIIVAWGMYRAQRPAPSEDEIPGPPSDWEATALSLGMRYSAAGMPFPPGHPFWATGLYASLEGGFRDILEGEHQGTPLVICTLPWQHGRLVGAPHVDGADAAEVFVILACPMGIPTFELRRLEPTAHLSHALPGLPSEMNLEAADPEGAMVFLRPRLAALGAWPKRLRLQVYPPWLLYSEPHSRLDDREDFLRRAKEAGRVLQ